MTFAGCVICIKSDDKIDFISFNVMFSHAMHSAYDKTRVPERQRCRQIYIFTDLIAPQVCAYSKPRPGFPTSYAMISFN